MSPTLSRLLLSLSAAVLAALGLSASFLPGELLTWLGAPASPVLTVLVQVLGAALLGHAVLDWMSRHSTIGGIYGRPLVVANLLHFGSGALALLKMLQRAPESRILWPLALGYALLALGYAVAFFREPARARGLSSREG
jgi:hypothetical protein